VHFAGDDLEGLAVEKEGFLAEGELVAGAGGCRYRRALEAGKEGAADLDAK
jgi:hypothetical protein